MRGRVGFLCWLFVWFLAVVAVLAGVRLARQELLGVLFAKGGVVCFDSQLLEKFDQSDWATAAPKAKSQVESWTEEGKKSDTTGKRVWRFQSGAWEYSEMEEDEWLQRKREEGRFGEEA